MPDDTDAAASLCDAIVHGSFPQSEQLLTSDLSSQTISALLRQISQTRQGLNDEIKADSKDEAGNVDAWIAQAKKVQEDIARCKIESQRIVEEHQHLQVLRDQATDYKRKVDLLESEINFTNSLNHELLNVSLATQSLRDVEQCLANDEPCAAATKLQELDKNSTTNLKSRTTTIIRDLKDELRLKARFQLEQKLSQQILVRREHRKGSLEVPSNELDHHALNSDAILRALDSLCDGQDSIEPLTDKLRSLIVHPLRRSARMKLSAYHVEQGAFNIELDAGFPPLDLVLDFTLDFLHFLRDALSKAVQDATAKALLPDLMDVLVCDWLNPELPTDLGMLDDLDRLKQRVNGILDDLKSSQWGGQEQLQDWTDDIQRAWLNKRKAATLDAVRKAFASARGNLRQVERVERQIVSTTAAEHRSVEGGSDDWDANWDEDTKTKESAEETATTSNTEEDDTEGWGFDDEEENEQKADARDGQIADTEDDDAGDAWGWGDESPVTERKSQPTSKEEPKAPNGAKLPNETEQEVTLTEVYSISEIPDHLIEIIGRDLSDAQTIQDTQHKSLDSASASRGLLALPTLALAMFRATAPSYYGASATLTDVHRYNDSLYIAERLRDISTPPGMGSMESDIKAMEKFAKIAYSKEMETQRIIVWDLLEGAQGFTSCTQFPYSQEIENAVSSVVDRIRTLHALWKPVLSTSALMQSLGSLVTMVVAKVISSIEEMDDISEPESQRLTAFCQQIATLEDLFLSTPPPPASHQEVTPQEAIPMTAVYVSNWLRFQYLINILESSLVDIKYLWTEGELSLEYSADEVVDLIKALFAESAHRRSAIAAIKGSRTSR
ncbi:hypothetical protein PV04_00159 [Phialophora macrospora]|uniref:ZW10 C-terminal helical domain-containing protein n=1 Tax=Phialophora macrospora TaxID=1851006 RepID=A0A0D2FTZ6_9EURO|nr:hypothetical protein PV04_00159 [Phialophora macrospora]